MVLGAGAVGVPLFAAPVTTNVDGLGENFTTTFAPYSITVLQMKGK